MLDSGWGRRCYCQISRELKPWHASNPLGIACMSARWKQLGTGRGGKADARWATELRVWEMNGYKKRLVKYWVCININILPQNIAMQLHPVSILPPFAFAGRLKRGSKAENRRHPIIWSFSACALTSLFVCTSLQKSEVSWPPSRCPILE